MTKMMKSVIIRSIRGAVSASSVLKQTCNFNAVVLPPVPKSRFLLVQLSRITTMLRAWTGSLNNKYHLAGNFTCRKRSVSNSSKSNAGSIENVGSTRSESNYRNLLNAFSNLSDSLYRPEILRRPKLRVWAPGIQKMEYLDVSLLEWRKMTQDGWVEISPKKQIRDDEAMSVLHSMLAQKRRQVSAFRRTLLHLYGSRVRQEYTCLLTISIACKPFLLDHL